MKTFFFLETTTCLSRKSSKQNKFAHKQIPVHTHTAKNYRIIIGLHNNFVLFQYVLTQIYLGRSHICRSLFLAILGRRKKGLRNAVLTQHKIACLTFYLLAALAARRHLYVQYVYMYVFLFLSRTNQSTKTQ